jgi:hypothetical protein
VLDPGDAAAAPRAPWITVADAASAISE